LAKAFDRVSREVIWWALRKKVVMEMYQKAETAVQIEGKKTAWFEVKVGVHQGSVLSPLLFAIVMDALTDILNKNMREFLCAINFAILGNSWEDVCQKYSRWKGLESRGLKVNIKKTKATKIRVNRAKDPISKVDPCSTCGK